jgi:hypothetical protein
VVLAFRPPLDGGLAVSSEALVEFVTVVLYLLPFVIWCAWWFGAVNWNRAWPMLAGGGWVPVLLLMVVAAFVWAHVTPAAWGPVPNGWWQCGIIGGLAALALFCGWLQGSFGWAPEEMSLEPPPVAHGGHEHH